jgi:RsiW-degrading membrane proteinase PrsW (M82 family)
MEATALVHAVIGLLPVLCFLGALVWLDSYKLVSLRTVVLVLACGVAAALAAYAANGRMLDALGIDFAAFSRYVAPVVEEVLKAFVVIALIRTHRVGFLVDAAILGFATGAGFAIVENLNYQQAVPDAGAATWIVRGFGTALMHGGVTAIFAMSSLALLEREWRPAAGAFVPGLAIAIVVHSAYNHTFVSPLASTIAVLVVLPALMHAVFIRGERAVGDWLGRGFDADAELIASIDSGHFSDSPAGRYLATLRKRFRGPVVADLLCYLRLHTELALRAKGLLLMRENGFDVPVDDETRAKFDELRFLERSIGRTGMLAVKPLLRASHRELWQLTVLE